MSGSLHLPASILKVYKETLTGFSYIYRLDGLKNTLLSQGCVLENDSHSGDGGKRVHSKDKGGSE